MPRNDSLEMGELTDTAYYILLSLVEPQHGYVIMKSIEELTNNRISIGPASLYTTLRKLLEAGLIDLLEENIDKKKTYVTTENGIEILKKEVDRRREMVAHAEQILKQKGV
ncbi:PadR family transcriptional regulator [Bacillus alkalicellulosilyticus]|uniref:PadR family transcriptional regulator n=1 Tax=Alkalihalobacterium alkalicellulosilyticum TaxID=1912214 RepID=UPI000996A579|nr:PadR family transcriptional regulator [Bacillus alkalicellulosilyticus]